MRPAALICIMQWLQHLVSRAVDLMMPVYHRYTPAATATAAAAAAATPPALADVVTAAVVSAVK